MCPWVYTCTPWCDYANLGVHMRTWVHICAPGCIYANLGVYTCPWVYIRTLGCVDLSGVGPRPPTPGCRVEWDSNQPGRRDSQRHQSGTLAWDIFQFSRLPKSKMRLCYGTSSKFSPLGHHNLAVWHGTSSNFGPLEYQSVLCCVLLCCVCVLTVSLLEVGRGIGAPAVVPSSRFAR